MKLGKLLHYHILATGPIFLLVFSYKILLPTIPFIVIFCIYTFIYRPYIDRMRLRKLGLYNGESLWKTFWVLRFRHYGQLMFGLKQQQSVTFLPKQTNMTRTLYILSFVVIYLIGQLIYYFSGYFGYASLSIMILAVVSTILRRSYLHIIPWWGGSGKNVIRYFSEP